MVDSRHRSAGLHAAPSPKIDEQGAEKRYARWVGTAAGMHDTEGRPRDNLPGPRVVRNSSAGAPPHTSYTHATRLACSKAGT